MTNKKQKEKILKGDLTAEPGKVYDYTKITGGLYASGADTRTAFPKLTSVGGWLDARGADTRTAFPKLTSVGGGLYASGADTRTAFPKLTSVGGWLYASGADTRTAFPKLTSVGGWLDARGDYSKVKTNDLSAPHKCRKLLLASFMAAGFSFADGILARIVSKRGPITRVVVCGQTMVSYVITDGECFSHGKTLKEARDGLIYKIGDRDKSEFESWTLNKVVSKRDAIRAYRIITGACESGVRTWLSQQGKIPEKCSVQKIIDMTTGAYGSEEFKSFFTKEANDVANPS